YIYSKKKGFKTRSENITFKQFLVALWECKWVLIIPFIILGGIYGGIFTPTEAGVVAVVVAIFISFFLERDMTIKDLSVVLRDSALTTSTILIIVAVATVFGEFVTLEQIPQSIGHYISNLNVSAPVILFIILLFLLVVGMFMEAV